MVYPLNPEVSSGIGQLRQRYLGLFVGVTGRFDDATGLVNPDPTIGLDAGYIWWHDENSRSAARALIGAGMIMAQRTANLRIWMGYTRSGELIAIEPVADSVNAPFMPQLVNAVIAGSPLPAANISGGRVLPRSDTNTPGLTVFVEALPQIGLLNDVPAQSVSADVPATSGYFGWSVLYALDGHVYSRPSSAVGVPTRFDLLVQSALAVVLPPGAYRLGAVSLYNGETDVLPTNTRVLDLRDWLTIVPGWRFTHDVTVAAGRTWLYVGRVDVNGFTLTINGELAIE